jgi:hypothetical protein
MSKGSADTRSPNLRARAECWERIWGKKNPLPNLGNRKEPASEVRNANIDRTDEGGSVK